MKRSTARIAVTLTAIVAVFASCIIGVPLMVALTKAAEASVCGPLPIGGAVPAASGPGFATWDARQVNNAAIIVSVGKQKGVPAWGYVVALGTAMQESTLLNQANDNPRWPQVVALSMALPHEAVGHDHDSVGLFQQRPNEGELGADGWGPVSELMTPSTSARKFYDRLVQVPGWEQMRLTDAAQAVQRSGTPEAYQQWEQQAKDLAAHVLALPNIDVIGGGGPAAPCGPGQFGPVPVGPGGWVQPVDKRLVVGSPYGPRDGRLHAGVDIVGANIRHQPIRAAATGTVITEMCNASTGNCDRDGGLGVIGCGWMIEIRHPGNVATRYCHMAQRPSVRKGQTVTAGTVIGVVGSSGNSSGPHLHYEVHTGIAAGAFPADPSSIDPVPFMAVQGAALTTG
ncbi:M23 family metallopeptidase [Couchioplanes caeruleus]